MSKIRINISDEIKGKIKELDTTICNVVSDAIKETIHDVSGKSKPVVNYRLCECCLTCKFSEGFPFATRCGFLNASTDMLHLCDAYKGRYSDGN